MASFTQRQIVPNEALPEDIRSRSALDEKALIDHLEAFLIAEDNKERTFVFSSPLGGCHIYCFAPSPSLQRNFWTCVTMGMSGTTMRVPQEIDNAEDYAHAEVSTTISRPSSIDLLVPSCSAIFRQIGHSRPHSEGLSTTAIGRSKCSVLS